MPSKELRNAVQTVLRISQQKRPLILFEAVDAVEAAVQWAKLALESMPVVLNDDRRRTALALYASLIELAACCTKLAKAGGFTGIPILGRSAIEAFVDLKNLVGDAGYLRVLEVAHDQEWLDLLNQAIDEGNPFVASLVDLPDVEGERAKLHGRIETARADGIKRQTTKKEKFARAGMSQEYETVYDVLCAAAHNSPSSLISRHIDVNQWPMRFVIERRDPAWVDSTLSALASLLRQATFMTSEFLGSLVPPSSELDARIARMHAAFTAKPERRGVNLDDLGLFA